MKLYRLIALLPLLAVVAFAGCDSDEDGSDDADRIVGTWQASEANLIGPLGIRVQVLGASNADQVTMTFATDGAYTIDVDGPLVVELQGTSYILLESDQSVTGRGTYELLADDQVRLRIAEVTGAADVDYDFRSENRLAFSVENPEEARELLRLLTGDSVPADVLNFIEGIELELERQ